MYSNFGNQRIKRTLFMFGAVELHAVICGNAINQQKAKKKSTVSRETCVFPQTNVKQYSLFFTRLTACIRTFLLSKCLLQIHVCCIIDQLMCQLCHMLCTLLILRRQPCLDHSHASIQTKRIRILNITVVFRQTN